MKKLIALLVYTLFAFTTNAQSPVGAWQALSTAENGDTLKSILVLTKGYQVLTTYNNTTGQFVHTNGGSWKLEGNTMTEKVEFNTINPDHVGQEFSFEISLANDAIQIVGSDMKFSRIDNGKPGVLQGAWLMSGRVRDGEMQSRDTSRPRKTMKILSGTRFQWIAYNTETKQFMGTGGGTYTTQDGEYTENIEFFSKDNSKVGLSLKFNYELVDGNWQHSGFSSKGDPISEVWSLRTQ
jgi:hypothetical protein